MINLQKGQTIDLRKSDKGDTYDLSKVTIGLGWDVRQEKKGFFDSLFGSKEAEYDLDAIAFLLDANGKVANLGRTINRNGQNVGFSGSDIIFFNNLQHPSGHIWLTGDNRTGAGDGDDEQIIALLEHLDARYERILFLVTIYQGRANGQHFSMLDNAFIRAVDGKGKEMARYSLSGDASLTGMCCMEFAEMYRKDGSWKFRAIGSPSPTDSFIEVLKKYVYLT
jgi:tellurium resistance protein TerD